MVNTKQLLPPSQFIVRLTFLTLSLIDSYYSKKFTIIILTHLLIRWWQLAMGSCSTWILWVLLRCLSDVRLSKRLGKRSYIRYSEILLRVLRYSSEYLSGASWETKGCTNSYFNMFLISGIFNCLIWVFGKPAIPQRGRVGNALIVHINSCVKKNQTVGLLMTTLYYSSLPK